jgi:hypothetical protein
LAFQVYRYESWLEQQEQALNQQLKYYESEIQKLRKQRKVSATMGTVKRVIDFKFHKG